MNKLISEFVSHLQQLLCIIEVAGNRKEKLKKNSGIGGNTGDGVATPELVPLDC